MVRRIGLLLVVAALALAVMAPSAGASSHVQNDQAVFQYANFWLDAVEKDPDTIGSYNGTSCVSGIGNLTTYYKEVYCRMHQQNIIDGGGNKTVERSDLAQAIRRLAIRAKHEYPNNVTHYPTDPETTGTIDDYACDGYLISDPAEKKGVGTVMYNGVMDTYSEYCPPTEPFKPLKNVTWSGLQANIGEATQRWD